MIFKKKNKNYLHKIFFCYVIFFLFKVCYQKAQYSQNNHILGENPSSKIPEGGGALLFFLGRSFNYGGVFAPEAIVRTVARFS